MSATDLDANARTALALRFVDDACRHVLGRVWGTDTTAGFHRRPERTLPFDQQVIAHAPVPVNTAEARDLEFLPAIGAALAARIVAERRAHGAYGSAAELASRVHGIGDAAAAQLSHALSFTQPWTPRRAAASTPGERFAHVASLATAPLAGETYHAAVASLIDGATSAVRVCMFHIAMGTDAHPTLQLLERLAAAKGRGRASCPGR